MLKNIFHFMIFDKKIKLLVLQYKKNCYLPAIKRSNKIFKDCRLHEYLEK